MLVLTEVFFLGRTYLHRTGMTDYEDNGSLRLFFSHVCKENMLARHRHGRVDDIYTKSKDAFDCPKSSTFQTVTVCVYVHTCIHTYAGTYIHTKCSYFEHK